MLKEILRRWALATLVLIPCVGQAGDVAPKPALMSKADLAGAMFARPEMISPSTTAIPRWMSRR